MKASQTSTFFLSRSLISFAMSLAFSASGFSTSTCLPASTAFSAHSRCCDVGNGM